MDFQGCGLGISEYSGCLNLRKNFTLRFVAASLNACGKLNVKAGDLITMITIQKCMNNLEFFQTNLRWSSGEFSLNCHVWRGMTQYGIQFDSHLQSQDCAGTPEVFLSTHT